MGKKVFSLCMALALCLGLLPVTALAAAPATLYVGETQITGSGYWTTDANGKLTASDENNYNVYYDGNGTLTLNNATIQGRGNSSNAEPQDYGIYAAPTGNQSVSLTIKLIGSNTVKGYSGICVEASGGDSTLVIQPAENDPQGSLEAIGNKYNGITISSGSGNASLTINNASVVANSEKQSSHGVSIKSRSSTKLSLTVNGGSLTAKGTYGIFYSSLSGTNPSTSLTVSDSALIKAIPSIYASVASIPTPKADGESGGIVIDGKSGTVYGDVTLQDNLTINEGETLTVGKDASLTVPDGKTLTNNGTIINNGTLTGEVGGSGTVTPKITTDSLSDGTVDTAYNQALTATGNNIKWGVTSGNLPTELRLSEDGKITGTPTTAGTYKFTVTATNASGSDSKEYTLNIKSATVPVTGVSLDKTSLELTEGGTDTLTATITPNNASNKSVTWASSNSAVATVDQNGNVEAVGAGTANITVTTADGGKTATCEVTVTHGNMVHTPKKVATCTAEGNKEYWTCGTCGKHFSDAEGKTEIELSATVIPATGHNLTKTEEKAPTCTAEGNTEYWTCETCGKHFSDEEGKTEIELSSTVIPAAGHSFSGGTCTVCGAPDPNYTPPYIPPSKPNWTSVARKLANAQPGDTVTVKMNGETEVPGEVWETIAGRDVTVILDMGGNVSWTVDGNDVPTATHFADMDFGVDRNTTGIDVDVINAITGQVSSVQITLAHDGEFGFTLTLTAPLGRENAGSWANLYHYHEDAESLSYETSGEIQEDGTASLKMTHASQYAIIIDDQTHQLSFTDVASGTWYEGAVRYAYLHDIMEGMSATTFQPNGTLSRAMAVQIFYNLEGQPDISSENLGYPYEDVNAEEWYGNAVYWARITGVATGYGDGTFQPGDSITRQEFAQMLYNYAKYKGYDLTAEGDLSRFPDSGSVADWAEIAMSWANGNQLINGHDDGTIDAGGTAIRAQAASILMRFDQNLVEK